MCSVSSELSAVHADCHNFRQRDLRGHFAAHERSRRAVRGARVPRVPDDDRQGARRREAQGGGLDGRRQHHRGRPVRGVQALPQGDDERGELRLQDHLAARGPRVQRALPERLAHPPLRATRAQELRRTTSTTTTAMTRYTCSVHKNIVHSSLDYVLYLQ